jgi:hypothetical protein
MTNRIQLPLTVRVLAAKQAAAFLEDISGMNAVVVATEDGFDIASAMKQATPPASPPWPAPFPPSAPWFRKKPAWAQTSA